MTAAVAPNRTSRSLTALLAAAALLIAAGGAAYFTLQGHAAAPASSAPIAALYGIAIDSELSLIHI